MSMTSSFSNAHPALACALAQRGYEQPTPVQAAILAPEHADADLLVSAQTGSGKTVAFGLAFASLLLGDGERLGRATRPLALVIAPTRELALQVQRELEWLYAPAGARVRACVGGMDIRREMRALADGCHIVVGTPGRLCDHLDRGSLNLTGLRVAVLDEADEMLDMGFREDLERILRDSPAERRTLMFSATIPRGIAELAARYQREAIRVAVSPPRQAHEDIEYRAHLIAAREREQAVVNTLRAMDAAGALVFCATRDGVNRLQEKLAERGFAAVAISGELTQAERLRAITALRDGRARVLVATDVAARGLDLPDLRLVIHADLPQDEQVLQHRSGRTGRAGRKGTSVLLVPSGRRASAERMLRGAGIRAEWAPVPSAESIAAQDQERLHAEVLALAAQPTEDDLAVARKLLSERSGEELVAVLVSQQRATKPRPEAMPLTAGLTAFTEARRTAARERPAPGVRPLRTGGKTRPDERSARGPSSASSRGTTRPGERPMRSDERAAGPHQRTARPSPRRQRDEPSGEDVVLFRVNVGRSSNADPRWVLPIICRRGGVVKSDIGRIEIMARETRFEVAKSVAQRFEQAARRPDAKDRAIRIERVVEGRRTA